MDTDIPPLFDPPHPILTLEDEENERFNYTTLLNVAKRLSIPPRLISSLPSLSKSEETSQTHITTYVHAITEAQIQKEEMETHVNEREQIVQEVVVHIEEPKASQEETKA